MTLNVGDWTHDAAAGGAGRVTFSLRRSRSAVTKVTAYLDGELQDRPLVGDDLRNVGAMYFTLPTTTGGYLMTVVAEDEKGCQSGANRPMTVVVH